MRFEKTKHDLIMVGNSNCEAYTDYTLYIIHNITCYQLCYKLYVTCCMFYIISYVLQVSYIFCMLLYDILHIIF